MRGRILVCLGTSGVSAGAGEVADAFERLIRNAGGKGEMSPSNYDVVRVGDRGLFRDVLVDVISPDGDRVVYEFVKPGDVDEIFEQHILGGGRVKRLQAGEDYYRFFDGQNRIVLKNCGEINPESIDEYIDSGGYEGLRLALTVKPEHILDQIITSGLRGRGGAGFLTGKKWQFCRDSDAEQKYVVCNADEGDPGAFMDRSVLEGDPHAVIEGMTIAGYAIGATWGHIYCRAEYPLAIRRLRLAIESARLKGILGSRIIGSDHAFDLKIKEGAGAFVCGEETALLASCEGRRGTPEPRPPYPAQSGLWGKPTLINNVETLANIRHILVRGPEWYASIGTENSRGTKVFALAGKIRNTGLVEVPMGTTIRELVNGPGGGLVSKRSVLKGVQLGGPSGGCLPDSLLDTPIDYGEISKTGAIMGSGGMIVVDDRTCMVDLAKFFLDFTVAESCGKCVPCRIGLKRMHEVLEKITCGEGTGEHMDFLQNMGETIVSTALCGLGNTAPNPVITTMRYFMDEYKEHIQNHHCRALVCSKLIKFEVNAEKCVKCGLCVKACPVQAIGWQKGQVANIDGNRCVKCKACLEACKFRAID